MFSTQCELALCFNPLAEKKCTWLIENIPRWIHGLPSNDTAVELRRFLRSPDAVKQWDGAIFRFYRLRPWRIQELPPERFFSALLHRLKGKDYQALALDDELDLICCEGQLIYHKPHIFPLFVRAFTHQGEA